MKTIAQFEAMTSEQFEAYIMGLPLPEGYLEGMRWLWSRRDFKAEFTWAKVMESYEKLKELEAERV